MKIEKISMLISIVLISLLCLSAVSAADDTAATDDADTAVLDEVQTIDNTQTTDVSYESSDIIVNTTGDSGDLDKAKSAQLSDETPANSFSSLNAKLTYTQSGYVSLTDNYTYDETADSQYLHGITINRDLTINGNGKVTIDGKKLARIFNIVNGHTVVLLDLTLTRGNDAEGGAIYNDGTLILKDCKFINNTADYGAAIYNTANGVITGDSDFTENIATYRGGGIFSKGSVALSDSVFDSNDIEFRAKNDDNGGAAIYNDEGTLTLDNVDVTNNLIDIEIRDGNDGHLINAVLFTSGDATITNSYFANNSGSWGGAIYVTNDATLDVSGTTFEKNMATFGASIYDEGAKVIVDDCDFIENYCTGIGSAGTSSTQAGAILVMSEGASATITNSRFNKNSAKTGGAVSVSKASGDVLIEDCEFTENTASYEGGAIYNYAADGATLTVKDSTFTDNTASNWGDAISNDAGLKLEGNTISGDVNSAIGNWLGTIDTQVKVTILDGAAHTVATPTYDLTATVTDDNNNPIMDHNFVFKVGDDEVPGTYYSSEGLYKATYTFTEPGTYTITTDSYDLEQVTTSEVTFESPLSALQTLINDNTNGTLDLTYGFAYIASYDEANKATGIIVNKDIVLNGNGVTIDGAEVSRLFTVTNGATLTLKNIILANGKADQGAGVYVEANSVLNALNADFHDNVAVKRGGAIYSEGLVFVQDSNIHDNDVTFRTANDDNGGAAIYNMKGTLGIDNTNITNNLKDIVIRNGNDGDLLVGVVVTTGETTIRNSYFANNTGSWGGAISSLGYMNDQDYTLTVENTTFEGNNATFGGAIFVESSNLVVKDSRFNNNKGVGVGSSGTSETQGGAIVVFPNGAKATITGSNFTANSANAGGAVSLAGVDSDSLVEGCTFTENTANDGGAIYLWTQDEAVVTVKDSTFTDNDASFGSAISTDGDLSLSGNTMTGGSTVPIANYNGEIKTEEFVKILDGQTITTATATNEITAVITDDNNNPIIDKKLVLIVNNEELATVYNRVTGIMTGSYTFTTPGTYEVTAKDFDAAHTTSGTLVYTEGTFTELQNLINAAEDGATITLTHAIVYNEAFDGDALKDGILVNKVITIVGGEGIEICGNDIARVLNVIGGSLTLKDVTICDGLASEGAGVHVDSSSSLIADNVLFTENVAVTRGGAIYSEGTVDIKDSTIKENYISKRDGAGSEDKGGAAIFNKGGVASLDNVQVVDNVKDYLNGDVLDGAIVAMGETTIKNSYFSGNKGRYGGAVTATETDKTLTVENTVFEDNEAIFGAAIYDSGAPLVVEDCKFYNNSAIGPGSPGTSDSQGGAILVMDAGATVSIKDSEFINNSADDGGAISFAGIDSDCVIDGCTFTENVAESGAAVFVWADDDADVTVTESTFEKNSAVGWAGAIYASGETALKVSDSVFKENTAAGATVITFGETTADINANFTDNYDTYNWGVVTVYGTGDINIADSNFTKDVADTYTVDVYVVDDAKVSVKDSRFDTNSYYSIVATDGKLDLSGNNIQSAYVPIYTVADGAIISEVKSTILANDTYNWHMADYELFASLTDDMGNPIRDANFNFILKKDGLAESISIPASFNGTTFKYTATFTPTDIGEYLISLDYPVEEVATSVIIISKSLTDLANIIANDEDGIIDLDGDYAYIAEFDESIKDGIVITDDKNITINGNNHEICGNDIARLFYVNKDAVLTLKDLTICHGAAVEGAGVYLAEGAKLVANGVTFKENAAENTGGAINGYRNSIMEITNCIFNNNTAGTEGGAIYADQDAELTVSGSAFTENKANGETGYGGAIGGIIATVVVKEESTFTKNTADYGGAICVAGLSYLTVSDSAFTENSAPGGSAGAILFQGEELAITDSTFTKNTAAIGGAILIDEVFTSSIISGCTFTENTAENGGAIFTSADLTVSNSKFSSNDPENGGAIFVNSGETLVKENTEFSENSADFGGAIYVSVDGSLVVEAVKFLENTATVSGGAIYSEGTVNVKDSEFNKNTVTNGYAEGTSQGAAISSNGGTIIVVDSTFTQNKANPSSWGIGTVYVNGSAVSIKGSTFKENEAFFGGAIFFENVDQEAYAVDDCTFESNKGLQGGAINIQTDTAGTVAINNAKFIENSAYSTGTGTTYNDGGAAGAIQAANGDINLIIKDSVFSKNTVESPNAIAYAGAVYYIGAGDGDLTIDNCQFTENSADIGGAVLFYNLANSELKLSNSKFTKNTAAGNYGYAGAIIITGTATIDTVEFVENTGTYGGAIFLSGADATIKNSLFEDNNGVAKAFNIYKGTTDTLTLTDNIFKTLVADNVTVEADKDTYAYGETVTVSGTFDWGVTRTAIDVPFTFSKDGQALVGAPKLEDFIAGDYEKELTDLTPGYYTIGIATFTDTEGNQYIIDALTDSFTIEKATPTITIVGQDTDRDELPAEVDVTVTDVNGDPIEGLELVVIVDGTEYPVTTNATGQYALSVNGLDIKNYTAFAVFLGNDVYTSAYGSDDFRVTASPDVVVTISDFAYGEDCGIEVILTDGDTKLDGVVEVSISGFEDPFVVAVADGYGFLELNSASFDVGTYTYTAIARENGNYVQTEPTEAQTFTVSPVEVFIDFHHRETGFGEEGVIFGGISVIEEIDEEGNPYGEEYIDSTFTLIFSDEEGVVLTLEGLFTDDEGAIPLPGTEDLAIGTYTVKVVLDDESYNLAEDTFEFEVTPKYAQVGVDLDEIDIEDGQTTTIHITVGEGQVWAFTSYGDEDAEIKYGTGTVLVVDEGDEWTKVKVLTNDADESYVGQEFYIRSDARFWGTEELYADEGETFTGIYIHAHPSGVVPQDIDGIATITIRDEDGEIVQVIEDVQVTDGTADYVLPALPMGEYYFTVSVDADGYDLEDAEFYDCLVVYVREGTYKDLQQRINEAIREAQENGDESAWIDLPYDFAYDADYDGAEFINGVTIPYNLYIEGNMRTISGSELARIFYIPEDVSVDINLATFEDGSIKDNGGAIYSAGYLTVHDSLFRNNKVTEGTSWAPGAPAAGGAAIYSAPGSRLDMWNNEFINNEALHGLWNSFTCGAVYASGAEYVSIRDSKFTGNAAVLGGAVTIEFYHVDEEDQDEATIYNCDFIDNIAWQGGAVNINEDVPYLNIADSRFNGNKAVDPNSGSATPTGGAISVGTGSYGTELVLNNCGFLGNTATSSGGAITLMNPVCELYADNCDFESNTATYGGAIYFYGSEAVITNTNFASNDPDYGGALFIATGDVSLDNVEFSENSADYGGAIYLANGASLDIANARFYDNVATNRGGAIFAAGTLTVKDTDFERNSITEREANVAGQETGGAAIYLSTSGEANVKDTRFKFSNPDYELGDKVYGAVLVAGTAEFDNCNFEDNKARWGAAIGVNGDIGATGAAYAKVTNSYFARNEGVQGGVVHIENASMDIENCDFDENVVKVASGAYAQGAAIYVNGGQFDITGTNFRNGNSEQNSGAIHLYQTDSFGDSTIANCNFDDNYAGLYYGAIYFYAPEDSLTITGSNFNNNKAEKTEVGALRFMGKDLTIIGSNFNNNEAPNYGAVYFYTFSDAGKLAITDSSFRNNKATSYNGALFIYNGEATVDNTQFAYNEGSMISGIWNYAATLTVTNSLFEENSGRANMFNIYTQTGTTTITGTTFKVIRDVTINVEDSYVGGADVNASGNFDWGVNKYPIDMKFTVDSVAYTTTAQNARYNASLGNEFALGNHTIVIKSFTDENGNYYLVDAVERTFTVKERQLAVQLINIDDLEEFIYGDPVFLEFNVTDAITGEAVTGAEIVIKDYDAIISYVDEEESYLVNLGKLKPGEYELSAVFNVDGYDSLTYEPIYVKVAKADIDVTLNIISGDITYGQDEIIWVANNYSALFEGIITLTITNDYTGEVIRSIDVVFDPEEVDPLVPGVFEAVSGLDVGKYTIGATYEDEGLFNVNIIVYQPYDKFEVEKAETLVGIQVDNVKAGEDIVAVIYLFYVNDNDLIPINGTVHVEIADICSQDVNVENGEYILTVPNTLAYGIDYDAYVVFRHTSNFNASDDSAKFNVTAFDNEILIKDIGEVPYATETEGTFTIVDEEGEHIDFDAEDVEVSVDDDLVDIVVRDGVGTYTIPANLTTGTHTVTVIYYGDNKYKQSVEELEFEVGVKEGSYTDLQNRIDNADGTLVLPYSFLYDADYDEYPYILIDEDLTIVGDGNYIDGNFYQAAIFRVVDGATLTISNAFLAFGNAENGGAVYVDEDSAFVGKELTFLFNKASGNGGAIYSEGDVTLSEETYFLSNSATGNGGAIYSKGSLNIEDAKFLDNSAAKGSAIYADYGSELSVDSTEISMNKASGAYGAVFVGADDASITNSIFSKNIGGNGAAIFWSGDNGGLTATVFSQNEATEGYSGGAVFFFGDNGQISGCIFENNTAAVNGGALIWYNQGNIGGHNGKVLDSTFTSNKAASGGAIYWTGVSGTIDDCDFYSNEATTNGAAVISTGADMTISDSSFNGNKAATDGAIYLAGNDADLIGDIFTDNNGSMGAIVLDGASISVDDSFFDGNSGMPVHYNILNTGTIESITNTVFMSIEPTVAFDHENKTYEFGEVITMTGTFDWGVQQPAIKMNYTINGNELTTTVLNGQFSVPINNQPDVGIYTVVIKSFTDEKGNFYDVNTVIDTFEVSKITPVLEVEGSGYLWPGEDATVYITLTNGDGEGIEGIVIVTVNDEEYIVRTDEDGDGYVDIAGLVDNKYPITAVFIGNDYYESVSNDTEFIDFWYHLGTEFDIVIDDISYGDVLNIIVENATDLEGNPLSGDVIGYIEDANGNLTWWNVDVTAGSGTTVVENLTPGEYNVATYFTDKSEEYVSITKKLTFNVDKAESALEVIFEDGKFIITLDGVAGEKLNETLTIEIDGIELDIAAVTDNGTFNFSDSGLTPGRHSIEVSFAGNDNYLPDFDSLSFEIPKWTPTVVVEGAEVEWGQPATIKVTVTDEDGNAIDGTAVVRVTWHVDGADEYIDIVDGAGEATFEISPYVAPGEYDVTVFFLGDDNYAAVNNTDAKLVLLASNTITIELAQEDAVYGEDVIINVSVTDGDGLPLAPEKVNVTVNGETKEYPVESGQVNLGQLPAGETPITVSYVDDSHEEASADITIYVDKAGMTFNAITSPVVYRDDLIVEITDAVNADNEPVSGTVTIYYFDNEGQERSATGNITNGNGEVKLTDLDAGAYDLLIIFDNESYQADAYTMNGIVYKADPELTVSIDSVEIGEKIAVELELRGYHEESVDEKVNLTINGQFIGEYTTVNGKVSFEIDNDLNVSEYVAIAQFAGNNNYNAAIGTAIFKVSKTTPVLTVEGAEVEWGLPATIKVSVSANGLPVEGTAVVRVHWYVDGVDQYIDIKEGSGEATFEISPYVAPGEYDVIVFFLGDENYAAVNNTDAKLVLTEPKAVELDVSADVGAYGEATNVTVTLKDASGQALEDATVTIYVDGKEYANAIIGENGTATVPVGGLSVGDHNITVKFDDGVHDPASEEISVTVDAHSDAKVSFTGENVKYGKDYPITITVEDANGNPLAGDVTVILDGKEYAKEAIDGELVFDIAGLEAGSYYVEVIFENPNYAEASYGALITVDKAVPIVKVKDAKVEWGDVAYIEVTVSENGLPVEGSAVVNVNWRVDGLDQYLNVEEGSCEAAFDISPYVGPGEYDLTVFFFGGRNYVDVNASAKLTLTAPKDAVVDLTVEEGEYGEDTNVTVTVTDKANDPIANAPVTIYVDGKQYTTATADENGTVTVPIEGLDAGDHNITVKFDDGVHTPAEETIDVEVDPASGADIESTVTPGAAGEDTIVDISAKDSEGNPLSGNAILVVDGNPYAEVPLDENGTASVPIKDLAIGDHVVDVIYDNPNYLPSTYSTQFTVKAKESELTVTVDKESIIYGEGDITASIELSADGKAVDGVVELSLNGELQNVTVTGGKATVKFNDLAAGNYTVVASFAGDSAKSAASDSAVFDVARKGTYFKYEDMKTKAVNPEIDGRIGEYFYFTLLDADGNPLANKTVSIGFNGKVYNRTTNESGRARLQINLAKVFRYTFAIVFLGDENYTSTFNVALIEVSAQTPKLTTSAKTYKATAKTKSLTATFKSAAGNPVVGRKISFTVNGKTYTAKTNAKGVATVNVSISKKGTYSFTAKFAGDDTYAAISKSAKLTIK